MAGALRLVSHVIRPALTTAVVVVSTAHAAAPTVVPLECGITWTMVGKTIIVVPDCAHPVPGGPPPYPEPPPDPAAPPPP
ncbi:hypothetical protein [Mycobacterium simiae]|uniref:hypothetical protein n=1 Tax=Mycobacterium simiae TaxID=1784 RepID=UPI000C7624A5|nr:hypothetical protein [Mycobacterium simiae]PLV49001.1 hypothetical protein X011_16500 [Mycobacterium tuberculosis variant microti OV254]BBX42687.1 hypothetical protein MSIM_41380 [Mycobacterium simiae]